MILACVAPALIGAAGSGGVVLGPGTLGVTTGADSIASGSGDEKFVIQVSSPGAIIVAKLVVRLVSAGSLRNIRGIIYANSGGAPGALVAAGTDVGISSLNNGTDIDLPFSAPQNLSLLDYWIGVHSDRAATFGALNGAGSTIYGGDEYTATDNPFGTPSTYHSGKLRISAPYTV